jgi:mono/diheme cytochrome c family protein
MSSRDPLQAEALGMKGTRRRLRGAILALGLLALAIPLTACPAKTGTYAPLDLFYEMHYSQSYRSQEAPRLTPPEGAVPYRSPSDPRPYTREIVYSPEEYAAQRNPVARTAQGLERGKELFRVNCSFCHGLEGKGDGKVSVKLREGGSLPAANLTAGSPALKPPGELYRLVSEGGIGVTRFGMPRFRLLLSPEDRWLLVDYVLSLQGR